MNPCSLNCFSMSTKLSSDDQTAQLDKQEGVVTWTVKGMLGNTETIAELRVRRTS